MSQSGISPSVVTVDGPSGAGKGTLSQRLAHTLGFHFLDSGALYRLLALAAVNNQVSLHNEADLAALATHLEVEFVTSDNGNKVMLAGQDVSLAIRTEYIGTQASKISSLPDVRSALINRQQAFARLPGLIADGRDMGTVVFPQAVAKIFLTASAEERAQRRFMQLQEKGLDASLKNILEDIKIRDQRDTTRIQAPLKPAADALIIDSTQMDIEVVEEQALAWINKKYKHSRIAE